jgi:K(+)-stimulated pyrophosphate-energized sodium pump
MAMMAAALVATPAHAAEAIDLPPLGPGEMKIIGFVLFSAVIALAWAAYLIVQTMRRSPGSASMQEVAGAIEEGAMAYLKRQIATMAPLVLIIAIGLYFMYKPIFTRPEEAMVPFGIAIAFVLGIAASYIAGFTGMKVAVKGNTRTANAALSSFKAALETAFRSGTVSGMVTIGLGLLGAGFIFLIFKEQAMKVLVGFGFGGCLAALFMRVGGGIFTKAADVGADLVGKVEKGIPEDDPRNAATIADNVGDNVGDCAGMAADVFESYEVTLVAAIILGAAVGHIKGAITPADQMKLLMYPLLVRAAGVFASIIGTWMVRGKDQGDMDPMQPINHGFWISCVLSTLGFGYIANSFMGTITVSGHEYHWTSFFFATLAGIILALFIGRITEYFTSTEKTPVTEVAKATKTGPATMILTGFGVVL